MLTNIHLHGMLGRKFGKLWKLDVATTAEAIKAIDVNTNGQFINYFKTKGREKKYGIKVGSKWELSEAQEFHCNIGGSKDIYIIPITKGNSSGWGKILVGALIIAAMFTPVGWVGMAGSGTIGGLSAFGAAGGVGLIGMGIGASLILGGIIQLLSPVPNNNTTEQKTSNVFNGGVGIVEQGGSIPVVYGRMLVTPSPIAISASNIDRSTTNTSYYTNVDEYDLEGGGSQYEGYTSQIVLN
jgi:predicted phage tail protein